MTTSPTCAALLSGLERKKQFFLVIKRHFVRHTAQNGLSFLPRTEGTEETRPA